MSELIQHLNNLYFSIILTSELMLKADFLNFLCTLFNTASCAASQISTVSEDAGIEPKTVALAVRRSNLKVRSHPLCILTA